MEIMKIIISLNFLTITYNIDNNDNDNNDNTNKPPIRIT